MAQELAVMFMRTDGRQGEGWEGVVQGREGRKSSSFPSQHGRVDQGRVGIDMAAEHI